MSGHPDMLGRLGRGLRNARSLQPVPVGETPSQLIGRTPRGDLHHYGRGNGPPLLIVYSLVNRAYLLDLRPERSVIGHLCAAGIDTYLLDWRPPTSMDRFTGLADYLDDDIGAAIAAVAERRGRSPHLAGVCQGGVLALCQAARRPETVASLTLLATPVDFASPGDRLARLARHVDFESLVAATGNVTDLGLNAVFAALKPQQLLVDRYLALADIADDRNALTDFLRMERWMYDSPDQAGRAFLEFARDFYQHNHLMHGTLHIGGEPVPTSSLDHRVFAAFADDDHLVPPAAASAIETLLPHAEITVHRQPGGHLGLFVGGRAHRTLYPTLADWLHDGGRSAASK